MHGSPPPRSIPTSAGKPPPARDALAFEISQLWHLVSVASGEGRGLASQWLFAGGEWEGMRAKMSVVWLVVTERCHDADIVGRTANGRSRDSTGADMIGAYGRSSVRDRSKGAGGTGMRNTS